MSSRWNSITLALFLTFSFSLTNSWGQVEEEAAEPSSDHIESVENIGKTNKASEDDTDAEAVEEEENPATPSVPVAYRDKVAFEIYYENESEKAEALEKAGRASVALESALTAENPFEPSSPLADVISKAANEIEIRIRGYKIVELNVSQQMAGGFSSPTQYKDQLRSELTSFVSEELRRLEIQDIALKFFLSIFFAFIGFIVVRQIHQGFNKAELVLEQKRESFQPVVILSETLISGQAVGGLLAFSLAIGRTLAYVAVILTTIGAILGQFETSRRIMVNFFSQTLTQLVNGFQSLLVAIPGVLLGLFLLFCLHLILKILDLFLKGARSGRISMNFLTPSRIPAVRFWGTILLILFFGPLIVASFFGRFHTPVEIVFLLAAFVLVLATLPVLISIAAGSFVLWQGVIQPGQWIEVGDKSGEIANVSIYKVTIVPETGGRIYIPMILFLFKASFEKKEAPKAEFRMRVKRTESLKEAQAKIEALFPKEFEVSVSCLSLSSTEFLFALYAPQFQRDIRADVLTTLSEAHENGHIQLTEELIKEVRH